MSDQSEREHDERKATRREFFRGLGRSAALAGLAGGAAALGWRSIRDGETCTNNSICRGCPLLEGCKLPQAQSLKNARDRENVRRTDQS